MNKKSKMKSKAARAAAAFISLSMIFAAACPAFAASSSPKEEVIYVKTDASGASKSVNAVNIFGPGSITDYGDYSEVRLMNSNEEISLNGDTVTFTTEGSRVYYQGTMDPDTEIPWDISIHYFVDGVELTPEEAAGATGTLVIRFTAEENPDCNSIYYDNYAIQATFLLDTEKCSNIDAPDATIANSGSNKQLTYTVLPGRGIDTTITAQVRDFEMDAVAINGIALNLNIEIDDEELLDKVRELMTAVRKLNNGAAELADGIDSISDGADKLYEATAKLSSGTDLLSSGAQKVLAGAESLADGADDLYSGLSQISSKSESLNEGAKSVFESLLSSAETQLESNDLSVGELTINNYQGKLKAVIDSLDKEKVYASALETVTAAVEEKRSEIEAAVKASVSEQVTSKVTAAVKEEVTEQVTAAVRSQVREAVIYKVTGMTAEQYDQAVDAGLISEDVQAQIDSAVSQQMASDEVQSQIDDAVSQKMASNEIKQTIEEQVSAQMASEEVQSLIDQTVEAKIQELINEQMASDEVQTKLAQAAAGAQAVIKLKQSLDDYREFYLGVLAYTKSVDLAAQGASDLKDGADKLKSGASDLADGIAELADGASDIDDGAESLASGASEASAGAQTLAAGTDKLYSKTSDMDEQVQDEIDSILESIGGDDFEAVSFTSEKNTNVRSVQFVIKTEPIEIKKADAEDAKEEEDLTILQKLLNLFK